MRLIDADAIPYKKIMFDDDEDDFYYGVTQPYIDRMPTVDAVPVVRCRECKSWFGPDDGKEHSCSVDAWMRPGNWFCPLGKRREDGDGND